MRILFVVLPLLFCSCKKNYDLLNINDPVAITDLGFYTTTEVGPKLTDTVNLVNIIDGYTDKLSYTPGELVSYYLSGPVSGPKQIQIKDVNRNVVFSISADLTTQTMNTDKPWEKGFQYQRTLTSALPPDLKSGIYYIDGFVPFVCKKPGFAHDITVVYPTNTINAYNWLGGKSLYRPDWYNRATVASFYRPTIYSIAFTGIGFLQWISRQSYDVNYISDEDLDDYAEISDSKTVIIAGHSEYWTRQARENIDKFVESGKNVLILSGNTMWFQVRLNKEKHLMICYKYEGIDPIADPLYKTDNWFRPDLKYPITSSIGADFRGGGYGERLLNRWNGYRILQQNSPLLNNTGLRNGDILSLPTLEYDGAPLVKMLLPGSVETPQIDNSKLNFNRIDLIGYDYAIDNKKKGMGTFIVFQKTPSSGTVVNVASSNWCTGETFFGADGKMIQTITKNMIDCTLQNRTLFAK